MPRDMRIGEATGIYAFGFRCFQHESGKVGITFGTLKLATLQNRLFKRQPAGWMVQQNKIGIYPVGQREPSDFIGDVVGHGWLLLSVTVHIFVLQFTYALGSYGVYFHGAQDLRENGIAFEENWGHLNWLQLDRRVLEHDFPKKSGLVVLYFCVRFYIESISYLKDNATIELFFLNAKSNLLPSATGQHREKF
ncbi:FERM domain-containing protein 4A, partial [Ophiophagus hannah]